MQPEVLPDAEAEIVSTALARASSESLADLPLDVVAVRDPELVLAGATRAAKALQSVINAKPKKIVMGGETYLEFEDWNTVGRFYQTAARIRSTAYVQYGEIKGFTATAEAVSLVSGQVISVAEADCLNDEPKWRSRPKYRDLIQMKDGSWLEQAEADRRGTGAWKWQKTGNPPKNRPVKKKEYVGEEAVPLFQLKSMAQTRAGSKVLRQAFSWVAVLAGYKPTPAEEMDIPSSEPRPVASDDEPPPPLDDPMPETTSSRSVNEPNEKPAPAPGVGPRVQVTGVTIEDTGNPNVKRYVIAFSDGTSAGTVNERLAAIAEQAGADRWPVHVVIKPRGLKTELESITRAQMGSDAAPF